MRRPVLSRATRLVVLGTLLFAVAPLVAASPASAQSEEPQASSASGYPESGDVLVVAGDTLYGIARRTLGDGARYVEIFEINRGRTQPDGGALRDPGVLRAGWVLSLPPLDPNQAAPPGGGEDESSGDSPGSGIGYTVVAGDTLYGIAREQLGDGSRYAEIFEINRGRPQVGGGTLSDPGVLVVGWVLELPSGAAEPAPSGGTYTVRPGDSLSSIAASELGDPGRFGEIFELNAGVPQASGGALTDPSLLRVGWVLQLPAA